MTTSLEQDYFKQAHEQYHQLIKTLSAEDTQGWEHGEIERYINEDIVWREDENWRSAYNYNYKLFFGSAFKRCNLYLLSVLGF